MNFRYFRENRANAMILFGVLLILGLILAVYALTSLESPDAAGLQRDAKSTRTALALTAQALLGPFPTSTAPTATASEISSPTWTPTRTPTRTRTPTSTPITFITFTARTNQPRVTFTSTPRPPATSTPRPTRTRVPTARPTTYP